MFAVHSTIQRPFLSSNSIRFKSIRADSQRPFLDKHAWIDFWHVQKIWLMGHPLTSAFCIDLKQCEVQNQATFSDDCEHLMVFNVDTLARWFSAIFYDMMNRQNATCYLCSFIDRFLTFLCISRWRISSSTKIEGDTENLPIFSLTYEEDINCLRIFASANHNLFFFSLQITTS